MKCKCKRCGYQWNSIEDKPPKVCPKCKSYEYQNDRKRGKGVTK